MARLKTEVRIARLWPWIEKTAPRRLAFAVVVGVLAAALHWAIFPITQARVTFIFFIPAIVLTTTLVGRWPGVLVAVIGLVNSSLMKTPGSIWVVNSAEQVALISSAVVSVLVILVGDYYRSLSRRELSDLHELHELSAALASIPKLPEQLRLILSTFARIHGSDQGIIFTFDAARGVLDAAVNLGFSARAMEALRRIQVGTSASMRACRNKARAVIEDTETDPDSGGDFRALAREEGIRAVHSTPLISRDGEVLGALTAYLAKPRKPTEREIRIADICARKASVFIERARAEELVGQRDRRFQSVLEASGVPFLIWSPVRNEAGRIFDFRFRYVNTAAAQVMRIDASEYLGKRVLEVLPRAWDEAGRLEMYVEALDRNEVLQTERQSAADGNNAWYHIVASPLDGDMAVWFADITQRKAQERQLVEADRRKDEFLATLAHELRNPLAPIRQAASIARSPDATDAQRRWSNNVIERQVQHMSLLLDDLLDVSRITHGTLQLRRQQTDLQSVVGAAVETARPLIDERQHRLDVDVPADLHVYGDPLRLAQVLSNLLTNAAKYTNPRGDIRITATEVDAELVMSVEDSGIGITSEDLPKVFGMFAQVGSAQEHAAGGLGIGLALAKGIVDLHGGRIEAASGGIGKGSRFTVRLPGASRSRVSAPASRVALNGHATHKRILLADDNRDAAESLAIILRLEGHEVEVAHDGAVALESFALKCPDVALLDIGMPKINGYDVARQIRARPEGGDVLLIAITGWAQDSDRARSRAAGFDHHLTKPVEPDTLIELLAPRSPAS
jgi:signal transduction histidine kinase/ActR/RegA family two-component response regulator